jgi:hypothetical protein
VAPKVTVIPWQFTMEDVLLYERLRVRLVCSYKVAAGEVSEMLKHSGLWWPVPNSDWRRWSAAMAPHMGARGIRAVQFDTRDHKIIDACGAAAPVSPGQGYGRTPQPARGITTGLAEAIALARAAGVGGDLYDPPTPAGSWLHYQNAITVTTDDGIVVGSTLPSAPLADPRPLGIWNALSGPLPAGPAGPQFPLAPGVQSGGQLSTSPSQGADSAAGSTFYHRRTTPTTWVVMHGTAARAGYQIPDPEVTNINGLPAVRCDRAGQEFFTHQVVGNALYPIYVAAWRHRYLVPSGIRGPIPAPPNRSVA